MRRSEYVVVGGGIAGASVAYHLSERTDDPVTVFDRQSLASETTFKSVAMTGLYGDETQYQMKRYAHRLYNEFLAEPRANPRYEFAGRLVLATTPETAETLRRAARGDADAGKISENSANALMEYVPGEELTSNLVVPELNVDAVEGALYRPKMGYMSRPQEVAFEFVERAKENGVEFRPNTPVREIRTENGRVTGVRTDDGAVPASNVVAAAGPWNLALTRDLGLDLPLRHTLAPALQLRPDPPLSHSLPSIEPADSPYSIYRRRDDEILIGYYPGSYEDAGTEYDPATTSDAVPAEIREGAIDVLERLLPSLLDAEIVDEWVGVRSMTPDQNPIVGWTDIEGLSLAAFNTSGIQLAPAVGDVIARQLVDGDPTEYYDALSVTRFDGQTDTRPSR